MYVIMLKSDDFDCKKNVCTRNSNLLDSYKFVTIDAHNHFRKWYIKSHFEKNLELGQSSITLLLPT